MPPSFRSCFFQYGSDFRKILYNLTSSIRICRGHKRQGQEDSLASKHTASDIATVTTIRLLANLTILDFAMDRLSASAFSTDSEFRDPAKDGLHQEQGLHIVVVPTARVATDSVIAPRAVSDRFAVQSSRRISD